MTDETSMISGTAVTAIWGALLTAGIGFMQYFAKKRDDAIDANAKAVSALELKVAENYATKPTVMALFQEATTQTKEAVARVEKNIETTNGSVTKLGDKMDEVVKSISAMQTNIMSELVKKT